MKSIYVNMDRCTACKTCEIACSLNRSSLSKRLPEAIYEEIAPLSRVRVGEAGTGSGFPIQCRHCEDAPCMDACPAGALYRDEEGLVLTHDARCIGCWMCIMVCPFGAPQPFRAFRKMIKCDRCKDREAPYCVESCPTDALILADSNEVAGGKLKFLKHKTMGLNFISHQALSKPG
jgi:anaerobic carbon-monoxide dehydrogenase iron sulfur subunit